MILLSWKKSQGGGCSNMKKLKSLLVSLVFALVCVSMVTSIDVVEASSIKLNKTSLTIYKSKWYK